MSKQHKKWRTKQKPKTARWIAVGSIIAVVIIGGLAIAQSSAPDTGTALRDSDTTFSFSTLVGQPAPEFTAIGTDGQPYTVTPGDGRPKAIVFYMGYG